MNDAGFPTLAFADDLLITVRDLKDTPKSIKAALSWMKQNGL